MQNLGCTGVLHRCVHACAIWQAGLGSPSGPFAAAFSASPTYRQPRQPPPPYRQSPPQRPSRLLHHPHHSPHPLHTHDRPDRHAPPRSEPAHPSAEAPAGVDARASAAPASLRRDLRPAGIDYRPPIVDYSSPAPLTLDLGFTPSWDAHVTNPVRSVIVTFEFLSNACMHE